MYLKMYAYAYDVYMCTQKMHAHVFTGIDMYTNIDIYVEVHV